MAQSPTITSITPNPASVGQTLTIAFSVPTTVTLPATLSPSDKTAGTAETSGTDMLFDAGEHVEYQIDAGPGGLFTIAADLTASADGTLEVLIDGSVVSTWSYGP
jgi:hypothetical protein